MSSFDLGSGFVAEVRIMPNGERRYTLKASDGSGYICTVAGATGAWQNAHFHKGVVETYIVQQGWMGFVEITSPKTARIRVLQVGQSICSQTEKGHNVYLPAGAVVHTVKFGQEVKNPEKDADWYAAPEAFDVWSKMLDEDVLARSDGGIRTFTT